MGEGTGKFIVGVIIGAALGAVVGMLFAPQSGEETRKVIKKKTKKYLDKSRSFLADKVEDVKNFAEKESEAAKTVAVGLKEKIVK